MGHIESMWCSSTVFFSLAIIPLEYYVQSRYTLERRYDICVKHSWERPRLIRIFRLGAWRQIHTANIPTSRIGLLPTPILSQTATSTKCSILGKVSHLVFQLASQIMVGTIRHCHRTWKMPLVVVRRVEGSHITFEHDFVVFEFRSIRK